MESGLLLYLILVFAILKNLSSEKSWIVVFPISCKLAWVIAKSLGMCPDPKAWMRFA